MTKNRQPRRIQFYRTPKAAEDLARLNQRSDVKGMAQMLCSAAKQRANFGLYIGRVGEVCPFRLNRSAPQLRSHRRLL